MHLLLPGRHHLLTNHHLALLTLLTQGETPHGPVESLLWAITSANHAGTRRNPLPAHRREVAIEEFAAQLEPTSFVYHVDDVGHSERFADYVLKKIEVDSQGRFLLAPSNALVATSTPEVAEQFRRLGFPILPETDSQSAKVGL